MLNDINLSLFSFINATPITSISTLTLAIFLAKRLILIFPLITIACWFWGRAGNLVCQRVFVCKTALALIVGLAISGFIGVIFPLERPFVLGIGQHFLAHAPTPSFPSNHSTIAFIFAFGFLFWLRNWIGLLLFIPAFTIAWARIFLGVHWPLDMVGAFLVAIMACGISQTIWELGGHKLLPYIIKAYQILFAPLIKKGWIRG
ncbi:undecaprenyl-diphosphate phosphatase [Arsenophonus nasoniae]|uniref:undecaprenyl-diphosphate phosphatase n=1 Tax=Arsenophonus nasoniae TaxID=638 RepID=A0AA95GSK6_9GAMM|nr:undecaprenyl-diphosphate phosphatase [Arsenophonus nasoniae]WGM02596.1 undecaprenyl-diphosphate phosphatase [Arsenophonus nasoniae]